MPLKISRKSVSQRKVAKMESLYWHLGRQQLTHTQPIQSSPTKSTQSQQIPSPIPIKTSLLPLVPVLLLFSPQLFFATQAQIKL